MTGLCSSIGERINQDAEVYTDLMIEMQRLLKLEWQLEVNQNEKESIRTASENGYIFTYCVSLRVYKNPKCFTPWYSLPYFYLRKNQRF